MYTSLDCIPIETRPGSGNDGGRRKLWQIDRACHGRVIGTCLSPRELRNLCRKLLIVVQPPGEDEFLRVLVGIAGEPSSAARRLHKYLDRKYWRTILRFTEATSTAALNALWRQEGAGDAAGAYWALATHPHATAELIGQVHDEVHDRVLPNGHAIRLDGQTLRRLQQANVAFTSQRDDAASRSAVQESAAHRLPGRPSQSTAENLDRARKHLATQEMEYLMHSLRSQVEDYAAKLALERVRAERAEASAREWRRLAILCEEQHRGTTAGAVARRKQGRRTHSGAVAGDPPHHVQGTG